MARIPFDVFGGQSPEDFLMSGAANPGPGGVLPEWQGAYQPPTFETESAGVAQNAPLSVRNRNKGNMVFLPFMSEKYGAKKDKSGFAVFPTAEAGEMAMENQLQLNQRKHGLNTIRGQINRWAGPNYPGNSQESFENYVGHVSKKLGVGPDDPLDFSDPTILRGMSDAMGEFESGQFSPDQAPTAPGPALAAPGRAKNESQQGADFLFQEMAGEAAQAALPEQPTPAMTAGQGGAAAAIDPQAVASPMAGAGDPTGMVQINQEPLKKGGGGIMGALSGLMGGGGKKPANEELPGNMPGAFPAGMQAENPANAAAGKKESGGGGSAFWKKLTGTEHGQAALFQMGMGLMLGADSGQSINAGMRTFMQGEQMAAQRARAKAQATKAGSGAPLGQSPTPASQLPGMGSPLGRSATPGAMQPPQPQAAPGNPIGVAELPGSQVPAGPIGPQAVAPMTPPVVQLAQARAGKGRKQTAKEINAQLAAKQAGPNLALALTNLSDIRNKAATGHEIGALGPVGGAGLVQFADKWMETFGSEDAAKRNKFRKTFDIESTKQVLNLLEQLGGSDTEKEFQWLKEAFPQVGDNESAWDAWFERYTSYAVDSAVKSGMPASQARQVVEGIGQQLGVGPGRPAQQESGPSDVDLRLMQYGGVNGPSY